MNIELKPCPFCGEYPSVDEYMTIGGHVELVRIACSHIAHTVESIGSPEFASKEWNTRAERTCCAIPHDNLNESEGMGDAWVVCGECGALLAVITDNQPTPNYCPNCGAKVVEG